jgi:NAD(P)-dependent dehydrogenase (short-subunit alcohol dehydrogenase family)
MSSSPAASVPPTRLAVLVTGGAVRIGREIALHFARAGWDIGLHFGRSAQEAEQTALLCRDLGAKVILLPANLADETAVRQLVPQAVSRLGRLDCVVNNASRFENDDSSTLSFHSLSEHIGPNLAAPIILAQALRDHVKAQGREGSVVNLLDQKLYNLNPDFFSYTMSKAGLAAATTMLAQSLAPAVRVMGVAPGLTLPSYLQDQATFEKAHTLSILGRSSDVQDIASSIYFAATNRSMTGSVLLVDGGQHLLALPRDVSMMKMS